MATITLHSGNFKQEYPDAHDFTVSSAGVLTFYWEAQQGGPNARTVKIITSTPFVVEEEIANSR
jgi:hypothetical protein